ncbi:carbohydrate sulfotransferase 14-like [Dendronephthya gigantea]|uniref:carbohydrate sulfotransferase 14-like n=1 Tax=Dendronephthya gigantea TaxID=151771 RepID=UPI00106A160A|nr:carbohydrate sulfotransferase 14-like [Dendronephthya gigantea]
MPRTTIKSSEDEQAEIDSRKRKKTVEKVCRNLNVTNVLKAPANRRDRKKLLQRFNVLHHIIVNEKHKVLYCFIPKVGCSNMKRIFLVMQGLYPSKFTEEQREHMLKNFYKFLLVRDPMERLASAYRNKWQNDRNVELHANLGKRIIEKYRYNNTRKAEHGHDVSFTEFSRYLFDTPPWELNEHWITYEDICRPCNVKYDFIGSMDTIARDVPHLMRKIHADETKYHLKHARRCAAADQNQSGGTKFTTRTSEEVF